MSEKDRVRLRNALSLGASESVINLAQQGSQDENTKAKYDPLCDYAAVPYLPFERLGLAPFMAKQGEKEMALRRAQLAMRGAEIKEALYVMRRINAGDCEWLASVHTRSLGSALCGSRRFRKARKRLSIPHCRDFFASWKGKLDLAFPTLAGHSFGGATLIEFLRTEQTDFPYGIVLDPWMEPVRDPADDESVRGKLTKPVYVMNSEGFSMWRDQYNKLIRVLVDAVTTNRNHRGWLMTLCGSNHTDFSDLPCLLPKIFGSALTGPQCIRTFSTLTMKQVLLLREQKHLFEIKTGEISDDLGGLKNEIHLGGMHFNSSTDYPRPSNHFLKSFQRDILRIRTTQNTSKSFFWELRGWRKHAEQDPNTRAYRQHRRMLAREIENPAREEQMRQRQRRDSIAASDTASLPEVQDLSEIRRAIVENDPRNAGEDEEEIDFKPTFVDPIDDRKDGCTNPWEGTVLDSDARLVYNEWAKNAAAYVRNHNRPTSLLTLFLWYMGAHDGLAPAGHLLVHTL
ncbi:1-alkyl-2-acetylglycerophosphocholine esterase [Malassezia brasiliensis]|uniref:1-alkyl-2-acetylglycerophosphocholine esterase n=1 Tax=Malassezia brasiliensis TaxID=1821822 RepID=A0AAF0DR93_9BASI|nr:1-alkyl-2-acetylglycerophosphocholine esterase [Malassezia brasiliensis]